MRFDWYQTTIEDEPQVVLETLKKLGHELRPADALAKRYRYDNGYQVHHHERGVVASVFVGGNGGKPHAFASSDSTDAFVDVVRSQWPDRHLVTRMDSAQDFNDSSAFNRLRRVALKVAKAHRMAFPSISDQLNQQAGRTQYIGSPSSDYRGRLYEKGWEQIAKMKTLWGKDFRNADMPEWVEVRNEATGEMVKAADWIRLEVQARPDGEEARRLAAVATPEQAWGFTSWSHELAKHAMQLDLERIYIRTRKVSKDEEAMRWMCQQYGALLTRQHNDLGDWKCVGLEIGKLVAEQARDKS